MSRDWFAGYCSALRKPKYRRLSPAAKGCLFHVLLLAGGQDPEACWRSQQELGEILLLDGFEAASLDELVSLGWFDVEDSGLWVHDWDDWQIAASKAVLTAYEAARKKSWRHRKAPPAPPKRELQDITRQDIGGDMSHDVPTSPKKVPDMSRTYPEGDRDAQDVYYELTGAQNGGYKPWGIWSGDKIKGAIREYGNPAVEAAMRECTLTDQDKRTLLDRTLARLAREAEKAKMAAPPKPKRNGHNPEQDAEILAMRTRLQAGEVV